LRALTVKFGCFTLDAGASTFQLSPLGVALLQPERSGLLVPIGGRVVGLGDLFVAPGVELHYAQA
jgi:hypothetical protein